MLQTPMTYLQEDGEHGDLKNHNMGGDIPGFPVKSAGEKVSALLMVYVTLGS